MSLLDSIIGSVLGNSGGAGPLGSVLSSILGGGQGAATGGSSVGGGGIGGLVEQFNRAGMGNVISSWVGNGQNQEISPSSLGQVFGHEQVQQWSQQTGMSHDTLLDSLSKILPHAVDQATPNGQLTSAGGAGASPFDAPGIDLPSR